MSGWLEKADCVATWRISFPSTWCAGGTSPLIFVPFVFPSSISKRNNSIDREEEEKEEEKSPTNSLGSS